MPLAPLTLHRPVQRDRKAIMNWVYNVTRDRLLSVKKIQFREIIDTIFFGIMDLSILKKSIFSVIFIFINTHFSTNFLLE